MLHTSACGLVCYECYHFLTRCTGCVMEQGKPFWTRELTGETCAIFACARTRKGLAHCGRCDNLPCPLFDTVKDPAVSILEHRKGIRERVARLKALGSGG